MMCTTQYFTFIDCKYCAYYTSFSTCCHRPLTDALTINRP